MFMICTFLHFPKFVENVQLYPTCMLKYINLKNESITVISNRSVNIANTCIFFSQTYISKDVNEIEMGIN